MCVSSERTEQSFGLRESDNERFISYPVYIGLGEMEMNLTNRKLICGDGVIAYLLVEVDGKGEIYGTEQFWGNHGVRGFLWDLVDSDAR